MTITRITARWSGFRGAPGYSNFFFEGENAVDIEVKPLGEAVATFFRSVSDNLPAGVTITIDGNADNIDEATGNIVGQVDFEEPLAVTGGVQGNYSAASGAVVNWLTGSFVNGRQVRGRTFIVPLTTNSYDAQGDITSGVLDRIRAGAQGLVDANIPSPLVVWSRPRGGAGGTSHVVTGSRVPDLGAVLRSRRD